MLIYYRYITKSFLSNFFLVLLVFIFLMFSINAIPIIELLLLHHAKFGLTVKVFCLMIPEVVAFVLPATFLMGSLITFFNFTENNENIVLASAGVSNWHIIKPIVILSTCLVVPYFLLSSYLAPASNSALNRNLYELVKLEPSLVLKTSVFFEPFPSITIYANAISKEGHELQEVIVMDKRDPKAAIIVVSKRLRIFSSERTGDVIFKFDDGTLTVMPTQGVPRNMHFKDYILTVSPWDVLGNLQLREPKPKEMTINELLKEKERPNLSKSRLGDLVFALYNRFITPAMGVLMVFLGGILPLVFHFRQRSVALISGLFIFFGYYTLYSGMKSLAKSGSISPFVCSVIPLLFLCILLSIPYKKANLLKLKFKER